MTWRQCLPGLGVIGLLVLGLTACGGGGGEAELACNQDQGKTEIEQGQLGQELLRSNQPLFNVPADLKRVPKRLIGCADLSGDGRDEMVVQTLGPTGGAVTPWAILTQQGEKWQVALLRPDIQAAKIQIQGQQVSELTPAYATNDPTCCPSGQRRGVVRWIQGGYVFEPEHIPPSRDVVFSGSEPISIGGLDFVTGNLPQAINIFGVPSYYARSDTSCPADWRDIGLVINFADFGGQDPCGPNGRIARATVHLREGEQFGWQTNLGLRLGDSQDQLIELYPRNRRAPPYYTENDPNAPEGQPFILLEHPSAIGAGSKIATLLGFLDFGTVTALQALPAAAGE